ncbi:MAG: MotA/TolQ/ExbB proton channel family protein [Gammaproteobacteria bacterium]|nr:MotA/TolQ/ExbB proton channel family protein [Gammaproteobacteria bacterium]MCY4165640.1 MotA/TolQ/ExbB proton channel family protein [Gammaproteobacteria bacterium]MCY4254950.1 MotA/TolQ/ExbB proton channel family protein [Gammaproteobacteria bacterium]
MIAIRTVACAMLGLALNVSAQAQEALSLDQLLDLVEQGAVRDNEEMRAREAAFREARGQQQRLLEQANAEKAAEERRSQRLENSYGENERRIAALKQTRDERLGALKELFGVTQQVAGDARSKFESSVTNVQYPDRSQFLTELVDKLGSGIELPSVEEMERLWWELQREMTESSKVVRFNADVISLDGQREPTEVVRVGLFNIVSDGKYLTYRQETGNVTELGRQPEQGRFTSSTADIVGAAPGEVVRFGLDPTLGGVLNSLVGRPNLMERIQQGALVGYLIIALGIIGLLISLERLVTLTLASRKVTAQLKSDTPSDDNALGRVLKVYHGNKDLDTETLELKLGEAIFKETPKLNRALLFIQIISVVAPLMGLLGTVTGMIKTFQAITLYGTGDPKLMAGGISQALVTTVLGLSVAIPMVLLHTVVSGRSRRIVQILQEQSTGIVAEHAEAQQKAPAA